MINLKCEICGAEYQKPKEFRVYNEQYPNVFYKWSLCYCDKCRIEKKKEAMKHLPEIIKRLL